MVASFFRLRRWALLPLLLLAAPGPVAAADACSKHLLKKVQADYRAIKSFSGRFVQEDARSDGSADRANGEIAYRRPGRMRWLYQEPNQQLLVTDGKTVWLFDPLLDNVTVQPLGDLAQGTPLSFLLGVGNLSRDFTCRRPTRVPPSDGLTYLELLPRRSIPGLAFVQLGLNPQAGRIGAVRMVDTQQNVRMVRLLDLRTGAVFPKNFFTFKIKKGMEVISK